MPSLAAVVERLERAGCVAAEEEAAEYLAAAPDAATLESWLRGREDGVPPAWLTGTIEFCGRRLRVDVGVFVPRDQTQELARRASALLPTGGRALDLCTGAGAIAAVMKWQDPSAEVIGIDIDPRAVRCARGNGVPALVGDLAEPIRSGRRFDLVTAVTPYVPSRELRLLPATCCATSLAAPSTAEPTGST